MIPKIIHYIWLGGSEMPQEMKNCIETWRKFLPDYRFVCWDDDEIRNIDSVFLREALLVKKWAFASDYVRIYAIYNYGGIYLDTDSAVYKSFNELLSHRAFIGRESSMHIIGKSTINHLTTYCFGAEMHNPFVKRCLDYYENRHFITSQNETLPTSLKYDIRTNSSIFCELAKEIGYNPSVLANYIQVCQDNQLVIYPSDYFDAIKKTSDTYSKHIALGSWRDSTRKVYTYTLYDKIAWRVKAVCEWCLNKFGYTMIELR